MKLKYKLYLAGVAMIAVFTGEAFFHPLGIAMANNPPNIILIQVDQMRPDHLNKNMPELMKLADNGVVFEHAYTPAPLCQPARTSIITGLYPSQTGIYGNQTGPIADKLRDNTFMNKLQEAGYSTALIGKHHYIDRFAVGIDIVKEDAEEIKKYGIDYLVQCVDVGEHAPNRDKTENVDDYIKFLKEKGLYDQYVKGIKGGGVHPLKSEYTEDGFIGTKASDFIKSYNKKAPFYLNVSFVGPHPPYMVPEEFKKTKPEDTQDPNMAKPSQSLREKRAIYIDMCRHIDFYIGEIVETLKSKGIFENTVFLFVSDHGDNLGDYDIWDKRYFYEQSAGIPLMVSGKGIPERNLRFGSVSSKALVSSIDLYPTILSLAGLDISGLDYSGRNLLNIIYDKPDGFREAVYSELGTCSMIRTAKWKMVFDPEQGGVYYLFNLATDPLEMNNLAGVSGYETVEAELTKKLLSRYITLNQSTQGKEQIRLQKVRVKFNE